MPGTCADCCGGITTINPGPFWKFGIEHVKQYSAGYRRWLVAGSDCVDYSAVERTPFSAITPDYGAPWRVGFTGGRTGLWRCGWASGTSILQRFSISREARFC